MKGDREGTYVAREERVRGQNGGEEGLEEGRERREWGVREEMD